LRNVRSNLYGSNRTITFFTLIVLAIACGKTNQPNSTQQGSPAQQQAPHTIQLPVIRTSLSLQPAFYQFNTLVGNAPQTPFDPNHRPKSRGFNKPHLSRESAGTLIYTKDPVGNPQTKYVLIGREKSNGYWNFMRGSVDAGDSFVQAAVSELNQETGGVYQVTENVLLHESFDVYNSAQAHNYACTFFVELDYVPAEIILQTSIAHKNRHFQEMSDYAWISLSDLTAALANNSRIFPAQLITGTTKTFDFYPYSFEILRQALQKNILVNLN